MVSNKEIKQHLVVTARPGYHGETPRQIDSVEVKLFALLFGPSNYYFLGFYNPVRKRIVRKKVRHSNDLTI